jgi:hypothetical protein
LPWRQEDVVEREDRAYLLEASEMEKVSRAALATFQLSTREKLEHLHEEAETPAMAQRDARKLPTQRGSHGVGAESLLAVNHTENHRAKSSSRT